MTGKCSNRIVLLLSCFLFAGSAFAADPPGYFDLRDVGGINYVSSVKSQSGGTCWTHGAMAAMESNLIMTGVWATAGEAGEPNLAEYHLDWWNGFNRHNNDDTNPPTGGGLVVHQGGDYRVTAAYLTRNEGAVRDEDGQSYSNPPLRSDPSYHYYYVRDIEWYVAGTGLVEIKTIKNRVMTDGAIGTCLCYSPSFINSQFEHYQPPSSSLDPNHAVAIVGWDDSRRTQASQNGAWLCKNSWGASWGNNGYFWISYYDKHCGQHPEMGAVSLRNVEPMRYSNVHYHDYHGWRDTLPVVTEAFNAFTALANPALGMEKLAAVSFFTAEDNVTFTLRIWDDFSGGQLLNELSSQSGVCDRTGFHTIDLDSPVWLQAKDDFYVSVELSSGGQPYDRTSDVPVLLGAAMDVTVESSASPGQSFFRSGGQWVDLTSVDITANFCIKALTVEEPALRFSFPAGLPEEYVAPGPVTTVTVEIEAGYENYTAGTGLLHYRFSPGASFTTVPLSPLGGNLFDVAIPGAKPGDKPEFFLSAMGDGNTEARSPHTAPADLYSFEIALLLDVFVENFETDRGWTVDSINLTGGEWERGVPAGGGLRGDPLADFDGSGSCFLTENMAGDSDVDGGPTRLVSPVIDLSHADDAIVTYSRWFTCDVGQDRFGAYISNSNGQRWVTIEMVENTSGWQTFSFKASHLLECKEKMMLAFVTEDNPNDSITEAAVDAVSVRSLSFTPSIWAEAYSFSAPAGCDIPIRLDAGVAYAGREYVVGGGLSGAWPGTPLPGGDRFPVNWDWLSVYILGHPGSPLFQGFTGFLDSEGEATARLSIPGQSAVPFAGMRLTFAFTTKAAYDFVSNPVQIDIEP
jgi:C1A family cysteine protease